MLVPFRQILKSVTLRDKAVCLRRTLLHRDALQWKTVDPQLIRIQVTDITPPYGGYPKFANPTLNDNYLPVWLQSQGYNTYYAGKLMNSHSVANYDNPYPHGWTGSDCECPSSMW